MADKQQIDSFLKENLGNWEVDAPPDAWSAISNGLAGKAAATSVIASKTIWSTFTKLSIGLFGFGAISFGVYKALSTEEPLPVEGKSSIITIESPKNSTLAQPENQPSLTNPKVELSKPQNQSRSKTKELVSSLGPELKSTNQPASSNPEIKSEFNAVTESLPKKSDPVISSNKVLLDKDLDEQGEKDSQDNLETPQIEEPKPIIHTAFSPDGDGVNDELVMEMPPVSFFRLRIFSLKGQLVFESEKPGQGWKGLIGQSGLPAESGNYRFILDYQVKGYEKVRTQSGLIFLGR